MPLHPDRWYSGHLNKCASSLCCSTAYSNGTSEMMLRTRFILSEPQNTENRKKEHTDTNHCYEWVLLIIVCGSSGRWSVMNMASIPAELTVETASCSWRGSTCTTARPQVIITTINQNHHRHLYQHHHHQINIDTIYTIDGETEVQIHRHTPLSCCCSSFIEQSLLLFLS